MALTTTQVNAAFVALLGRAAEGNANAWAVNSADTTTLANTILSVDGKFKDNLEQAKTNEDFVAALYKQVLGREADADGKAFWLKALANGTSRDELKANFLAAAKANNEDLSKFNDDNQDFLSKVYSTLLNREVDSSGLEYWTNLLNNGTSKAEVVASIIDAINANQTSEDYAIYNAKMSVANAVTAAFAGPKAGLSEEQSKALNDQLVSIMNSVTGPDVTEESIKSQIDNVVGLYGKEAAPLAFKAVTKDMESYELGNADSTSAQTFRGTINLQDTTKSTISNKATLNTSKFSDTLVVDVIPSIDKKEFDYSGSQVETFAKQDGIKNLTINNGTAAITNLDNTGISQNLKITGAANVSGSVSETLNYLEVNTGGNAETTATIKVTANLKEYVGKGSGKDEITISGNGSNVTVSKINTGAGDDKLTVSGSGSVVNVDLGSGNDELTVSGAGASISGATINLGAGDDKITLTGAGDIKLSDATIDGGAGRDTLIVNGDISDKGDFTLKNIEVLQISGGGTAKLSYAQIKDQTLTLTKSGGGTLEIKVTNNETTIDLTKLNNKTVSGDKTALDKLTLDNVGSGATVTLNKDDGIAETIKLAADAKGDGKAVTINGIGVGDKLDATATNLISSVTATSSTNITKLTSDIKTVSANKVYFMDTSSAIDSASAAVTALSAVTSFASNAKALIGFNYGNKSYLFAANGTAGTTIEEKELTLVGIVDNKFGDGDTVNAGVITFA